MELIDLNANVRTQTGKGPARVLRREGQLPAILYGPGSEPVQLSIVTHEFDHALKNSSSSQPLFNLAVQDADKATHTVMIKEMQTDPVSREYLHVDFYEIDMKRKIRANVPVVTKGRSRGVEMGGLLQIIRHELEVLCLPLEIPDAIEIDITELDVGDSVHVADISMTGDVELPSEINFTVLTVLSPKKEDIPEEEAEEEELEEAEGETGETGETEGEA